MKIWFGINIAIDSFLCFKEVIFIKSLIKIVIGIHRAIQASLKEWSI